MATESTQAEIIKKILIAIKELNKSIRPGDKINMMPVVHKLCQEGAIMEAIKMGLTGMVEEGLIDNQNTLTQKGFKVMP